jgi:hypothetical protein
MKFTTDKSQNRNLSVEQRLQALTLIEENIAIKIVQVIIEVFVCTISDLKKKKLVNEIMISKCLEF